MTRHHQGFTLFTLSAFPVTCSSRMEREPLGLETCASHPAVTSDARQAGDRSSNTDP